MLVNKCFILQQLLRAKFVVNFAKATQIHISLSPYSAVSFISHL